MSELSHPVILFYRYTPITDPMGLVQSQKSLCATLGLKGRVLIAHEGINGTLAGPAAEIARYITNLKSDPRFTDLEFKFSAGDPTTFPKLVIKVRPEIVTLNAGMPLTPDQDNHLSPTEWKRMLEQDPAIVLVDVRNRYESDAGKFAQAVTCSIDHFRELPDYLPQLEHVKDRKVLLYCTGGIRCEKASALFRQRGFQQVFQLHGGILTYQQEFGNEHWLGECFVFDQRMTVRVEKDLRPLGQCAHTGRPTTRFVNCLHDPCHQLFLLALETEQENPDSRLCPACRRQGLTAATAIFPPVDPRSNP